MTTAELNQAMLSLKNVPVDSSGVELLLRISRNYIIKPGEAKQDMDSALLLIRKAETLSKKINYPKGICNSAYQYAMALRESGEKEKAKQYANTAIKVCEKYKQYQLLGHSYTELSHHYVYWIEEDLASKILYNQKAYEAFVLSEDKERQAYTLQFLGDLHNMQSTSIPLAITELKKSLQLYEQIGHTELQGVYSLLGLCHVNIKQFEAALPYALKAEQIALKVKDSTMQFCTILIRIGSNYLRMNDNKNANTYYLRALEIAEKHHSLDGIYESAANWAVSNMATKPMETLSFFKKIMDQYPPTEDLLRGSNVLLLNLYSYADKYIEAEKQAALIRNGIIAAVIVLIGFVGLLFNQYNIKRKTNRQLLARQKEIDEKNKALQRLVEEKEWLLKEIHHRVKNNLQTVVSLLESQSAYLQNDALLAIQDSQNRIHAMSLIHQKLYQSDSVASIDMSSYLPELINYLKESFSVKQQIRFQLNISPIQMDVSQAIPVGLILNEAITNSIKYAFPVPGAYNNIAINMSAEPGNRVQLTIKDNGIGLPGTAGEKQFSGLGLKLMRGLTEDLEGNFSISSDNGTSISVNFMANTILTENVAVGQQKLHEVPAEKEILHQNELSVL